VSRPGPIPPTVSKEPLLFAAHHPRKFHSCFTRAVPPPAFFAWREKPCYPLSVSTLRVPDGPARGLLLAVTFSLLAGCSDRPEISLAPGGQAGAAVQGGSGATSSAGGSPGVSGGAGTSPVAQGGTGGGTGAPPLRGPTPATATAKFPFPQNRHSPSCVYPAGYRNEDVLAVYDQWKTHLVTSAGAGGFRRVQRVAEPGLAKGSTVSEGIAYGMLISVYMNDQPLFDDLWKYSMLHTWNGTLLMNWYIHEDGNVGSDPNGSGAATDADEDMAWALVMASYQWGGQGTLEKSYSDYAKQLIEDIWKNEIHDGKLPKNGSSWGDWNNLNVSYFAPSYYRVFAKVSGREAWGTEVIETVYDTIQGNLTAENGNQTNGLVPAFSNATGGAVEGLKHHYQYDSCRTPFRIGLDACQFSDPSAKAYLAKTSGFFAGIGAANIKDGYELNGTPKPEFPDVFKGRSAAFIGPAGVGAMHSPQYQGFVDDVWKLLVPNDMWCGGQYYDESWTMLSLLVLSGNFLDYTVETPK
jgi:endo-1,4-beta-D-glucanase Y